MTRGTMKVVLSLLLGANAVCACQHAPSTTLIRSDSTAKLQGLVLADFSRATALQFAAGQEIAPTIREELDELSRCMASVVEEWNTTDFMQIHLSPDGTSVSLFRYPAWMAPYPSGVWLWPSWRDPDQMLVFPDHTHLKFISPHIVVLLAHDGGESDDDPGEVVDLRQPDLRWHVESVGETSILAATENRTWYGKEKDRHLLKGQLLENGALSFSRVENIWNVKDVVLMHEGQVIIIEKHGGSFESYTDIHAPAVDRTSGAIGDDRCHDGFSRLFRVSTYLFASLEMER